ncbi:MAG: nucleotidyltransferase domain-containing protein [Deltaproteobacteria bacterium]|nr:nucleotidyltransferase domain-containing protein [Deltaproteobacteria bacterium]
MVVAEVSHKKDVFMALDAKTRRAVTDLKNALAARLGQRLREVRLFGSRTTGHAGSDSDVDLLQPALRQERRARSQQGGQSLCRAHPDRDRVLEIAGSSPAQLPQQCHRGLPPWRSSAIDSASNDLVRDCSRVKA